MEDINHLLDLPSPSNSYQYMYGDAEQYLDTTTSEEGQSSVNSPYDLSYPGEFPGSNSYPSPDRESGSQSPRQATAQAKAPAKRKRENRYKNAPPSVLSRRRAQNRASQRAYRERKDQRIKDLEQLLNDAKSRNDVLSQAYAELHAEYVKLKTSQLSEAQQYPAEIQFDPTIGMTNNNNDRLDMDMYVYSDMNNYSLS